MLLLKVILDRSRIPQNHIRIIHKAIDLLTGWIKKLTAVLYRIIMS